MLVNHLPLLIAICIVMLVLSCLWLAVLYFFPKGWAALVQKENTFWVGTGLLSAARAEQIQRLEAGIWAKLMAGLLLLATAWLLSVLLHLQQQIDPKRKASVMPPSRPQVMETNRVSRKQ